MSWDLSKQSVAPDATRETASDADLDLPIQGFKGTPEEIERQWFEKVYTGRGDRQKQLTWRAVLMGGVLGMFMAISNLYTTLKLGWSFGVVQGAHSLHEQARHSPRRGTDGGLPLRQGHRTGEVPVRRQKLPRRHQPAEVGPRRLSWVGAFRKTPHRYSRRRHARCPRAAAPRPAYRRAPAPQRSQGRRLLSRVGA